MDLKKGAIGGSSAQAIQQLQAQSGANSSSVTAVNGGTYQMPATEKVINILNIESAGDLDSITVQLPAARIGQRAFVHSTNQINTVMFTTAGGSVDNGAVMLSPGDSVDFTFSKPNTWSRGI